MNILSVNAGADTGGLSIGMKRAFDRHSDMLFRSLIRASNYIRYPMDADWSDLDTLVAQADVLHLHNSFRTLAYVPNKGRSKGLVIYHHGSQFRRAPTIQLGAARQYRAVQLASTLDIWSMAPKELEWVPAPYDLDWLQQIRQERYEPHEGLIVAHAPTDRAAKGTQALIAAVDELKQTYPIRLLLIEKRPWQKTLALKATADIFVDQLLLGYGCNGIEAMGMGIPVISGVDVAAGDALRRRHPELRVPAGTQDAMAQHWGELPYLHATQSTIREALEAMVADKALRDEYAQKGRAHAERFHSGDVVVRQLEKVYQRSAEMRGIRPRAVAKPNLPDVVYVVRPGERNEELRYSLRSLVNLPHGKVWIAGHCPSWVTGVGVIPVPPQPGSHVSTKANLRAACEHPEVSEQFVYFNDDFFVMQPVERMPVMHRGSISAAMKDGMRSSYTRAMKATRDLLIDQGVQEPLCYELHAPTLVTKSGMLEALALCSYPMIQERSVYGNLHAIGGDPARNFKVYRGDYGWKAWPFLSTNDTSFASQLVGEHIRHTFAERGPYETDAPAPIHRGRVTRSLPVRRPVRYSNASVIRRISVRGAA